jgi:hypothetical protein
MHEAARFTKREAVIRAPQSILIRC